MLSERRCAVTVIVAISDVSALVASAAVCANAAPATLPLRIAAIAHDNFGFEFMLVSPDN
jgi:hypothetical protein